MENFLERIWWNRDSRHRLLEPFLAVGSLFYRIGLTLDQWRQARNSRKLPRPVISVGNLTVGGTGKTPLTLWLAEQAVLGGKTPCILTRGYGSNSKAPRKVDPACSDYREYGDEPLLMARRLNRGVVYVGRDRFESGQLALRQEKEIDLFLLDDGFQHRSLARDYDIALVDAERGFGNGRLLPWGPLREPVEALERADIVGRVWRTNRFESSQQILSKPADLNLGIGPTGWRYLGKPEVYPVNQLPTDRKARLLSGIGAPKGFEATVEACGLTCGGHAIFPDHHPYTAGEVQSEVEKAAQAGDFLLTTAKDGVRLETCGFLWTDENLPLILEVSLIPGDGADYLYNALSELMG